MQYVKPTFTTKRKDPVRRFLARMSHEFKVARGPMTTQGQHVLGHLETLFIDHTILSLILPNRHKVSDKLWRSSQVHPLQIGALARRGIRTIINLRGSRDCASYYLERDACKKHGITLVDFPVNSRQPPTREILAKLEQLFQTVEYPALMHCKAGSDRVGIMSALYLLIAEKKPVEEAMEQLSLRFGHVRHAKTGVLDRFLEEYLIFNQKQPLPFMEWAMNHYDRDAVIASHKPVNWAEWIYNDVLRRE